MEAASAPRPAFPLRSPKLPLLEPSLSHFAAEYAAATLDARDVAVHHPSVARVLWSVAEAVLLPRIERPGEKGGDGIYVERTLLDAFLPFNATISVVRSRRVRPDTSQWIGPCRRLLSTNDVFAPCVRVRL